MAHRKRFVRGARRQTLWMTLPVSELTMTAGGGTIVGLLNAAALALRPFTVVRSIFEVNIRSDQAGAIERQVVGFGACVVSDQAAAIGVTAVPTPLTDLASDLWYLHGVLIGDESNLTDRTRGGMSRTIESRAMRKVEDGQDIAIVAEMSTVGGGVTMISAGRFLVKTH